MQNSLIGGKKKQDGDVMKKTKHFERPLVKDLRKSSRCGNLVSVPTFLLQMPMTPLWIGKALGVAVCLVLDGGFEAKKGRYMYSL